MNPDKTKSANKRKALKILLVAVIILTALILLRSCGAADGADSLEGRQAFLRKLGWEIDPASEDQRTVQLPQALEGMLLKYNELQLSQGYDLQSYAGKTVMRYVYEIVNYPEATEKVLATLLVHRGKVIGGDITDTAPGGKVCGFKGPQG